MSAESHERIARAVIACLEDGLEPYGVKTCRHGFELSVGQGNSRIRIREASGGRHLVVIVTDYEPPQDPMDERRFTEREVRGLIVSAASDGREGRIGVRDPAEYASKLLAESSAGRL